MTGTGVQAMGKGMTRRGFLAAGVGVAAGLWLPARPAAAGPEPRLRFVQLSDPHLGYRGDANRDVAASLERALAAVDRLQPKPALLVVTGDLTQAADQDGERRRRLLLFRRLIEAPGRTVYVLPGEHDALADGGAVYRQVFGGLYYTFSAAGVHFFALDNVSRGFFLGREQLAWLRQGLERLDPSTPVVLLAHAPLHTVFTPWNWYTYDGAEALRLLARFRHALVLSGHVHQVLRAGTQPAERSAAALSWPYPEPRALTRLFTWPQSQSDPFMGLGWRMVEAGAEGFRVEEHPLAGMQAGGKPGKAAAPWAG